ncbi:MAG: glycosyltransferase family 2 protein [Roseiflexus sp.]|nr:glycosyltransferase family 2 protein [Roseiflexus sp.]MCS7290020.1 glycosyltransferase family 2 protein [Roseiflexus sp.]MDW8233570.1 glycosyltransferase family 2 protein [Roseiflexaceae bacterium]
MIGRLFWCCVAMVGYVYAGYPALLTILARLRPPQSFASPANLPTVTLLIAAYNEQSVIAAKLENSLALDYPHDRLQILVAADGSDDATPAIVASFASRGVELSYRPERAGKLAAIIRALAQARGEIVVLSDANNLYDVGALRALIVPFIDPRVGAVTGAKVIAKGDGALGDSEGLYWKYESYIKRQETRLGSCTGAVGEIMAVRRSLLEQPLPPEARFMADDLAIAMHVLKQGYRVVYAPAARSIERVSASAQDERERRARIVAQRFVMMRYSHIMLPLANPLLVWQIVSHKYLRPLVPLAMIGALLANLAAVIRPTSRGGVMRLAHPYNWVMLALQAGFYALAWAGGRSERRGMLGKLLYIPAFLVNSNCAALIGLYRFLTGRHTSFWNRVQRREHERSASEQSVASA